MNPAMNTKIIRGRQYSHSVQKGAASSLGETMGNFRMTPAMNTEKIVGGNTHIA